MINFDKYFRNINENRDQVIALLKSSVQIENNGDHYYLVLGKDCPENSIIDALIMVLSQCRKRDDAVVITLWQANCPECSLGMAHYNVKYMISFMKFFRNLFGVKKVILRTINGPDDFKDKINKESFMRGQCGVHINWPSLGFFWEKID